MTEPPGPHEVTLGEVYRAILDVRQEQRDMRRDLIGRAEYESDQEGTKSRLDQLTIGLADERKARELGDERIVTKAEAAKRWAITTAISAVVLILGILGFIFDIGGGPA